MNPIILNKRISDNEKLFKNIPSFISKKIFQKITSTLQITSENII